MRERVQLTQTLFAALARRTEDLIDCRKLQIVLHRAKLEFETKTSCSRAQEALEFLPLYQQGPNEELLGLS